MFYYKATISYKGTHYYGWQDLNDKDRETIQGTISKALKKIADYNDYQFVGASRTDAGVHALGQVCKIGLPADLDSQKLLMGLNSLLPKDIRVLECESTEDSFNPIKQAKTKEYHYYFSQGSVESPLLSETVLHCSESLDLKVMMKACSIFVGEHDFYNFCARDSKASTTVRRVFKCEIQKENSLYGEVYSFRILGEGFLKQMVRYLVGTLFELGKGNISEEEITDYLIEHKENKLSKKVKSCGLHLIKIDY